MAMSLATNPNTGFAACETAVLNPSWEAGIPQLEDDSGSVSSFL
jgi:hypothetical protein